MPGLDRNLVVAEAKRWALVTVALVPVVFGACYAGLWLWANFTNLMYRKVELILLIAAEGACALIPMLAMIWILLLGCLLLRLKRGSKYRIVIARGFALCVSLLLGLAAAEAGTRVWLRRIHRVSEPPVAEIAQHEPPPGVPRFAEPRDQIELPTKFADAPDSPDIDLVVVGESSAEGVPFQKYLSIGRIIAWHLGKVLPDRPVRLNVVARSGDTLEKQHQALAALERRPDILLIYCGHNEFFSRLWWSRNTDYYLDAKDPYGWQVFVDRVERTSALCRLVRDTADAVRRSIPPEPTLDRDLIDVPIYTQTEYTTILRDFRRRLDVLVSYAKQVGATPVLILPPGNDGDFEPNRSFLPATTTRYQRESFRNQFLAARRLERTDRVAAIERYRILLTRQPGFAETHFRLGRLLEQSGEWEGAFQQYAEARNLDGHPMRCLSDFHQAYREVAARHGCILIDGQSYFHAIGRHGMLDESLFQDAMHPSFRGHIALAQAVLIALRDRKAFGWPEDASPLIIEPAECASHFGIDVEAWKSICYWNRGFNKLTIPLRYDPSLRFQKLAAADLAVERMREGMPPEKVGLLNIGLPAPVPLVPFSENQGTQSAEPATPIATGPGALN